MDQRDFFISYNSGDKVFADAFDAALKQAGFTTHYAGTDCMPGTNVPIWMQRALAGSTQTLAVCSPNYFSEDAVYSLMEMMAAIWADPAGENRRLIPVQIEDTRFPPLIAPLARITPKGSSPEDKAADLVATLTGPGRASERDDLAAASPRPDVCRIDRPPLTTFAGHEAALEALHRTLQQGNRGAVTQAISGMGGVGKTTLAAEYAHRFGTRGRYGGVWWVNAEAGPVADLAALTLQPIEALAPARDAPLPDQARAALAFLAAQDPPWLLIYDNAENPDAICGWLPAGGAARVIITSRFADWTGLAEQTVLSVWDGTTTTDYLLATTGRSDRPGAAALADALSGLPLAADQAAAFLRENTPVTFADYTEEISNAIAMDRADGVKGGYEETVYATLAKSIATLPAETQDLLCLLSWLSPDGLDLALLLWDAETPPPILPDPLCAALSGKLTRGPLVAAATRLSLLSSSGEGYETRLFLHRLTQVVLRRWQSETGRADWSHAALNLVLTAFPADAGTTPAVWQRASRLMPSVLALVPHHRADIASQAAIGSLLFFAGAFQTGQGNFEQARSLLEQARTSIAEAEGTESAEYAAVLNDLSNAYVAASQYDDAEAVLQQALQINRDLHGPDTAEVATQLTNLAGVFWKQVRYPEAEDFLNRSIAIFQNAEEAGAGAGENALSLANCFNGLGGLYDDWAELPGQIHRRTEALALKNKAVDTARIACGERHPTVAAFLYNLFVAHWRLDHKARSVGYLNRSVAIMLSLGLFEHPETQRRFEALMEVLADLGNAVTEQMVVPLLAPEILIVEGLMHEWVAEDTDTRRFGPQSFFADKPELLQAVRDALAGEGA